MSANPLSPEALKELRELEQKATPGPWDLFGVTDSGLLPDIIDANLNHVARVHGHNAMAPGQSRYDAELIAAMRNALPALLAELERLFKENADLRKDQHRMDFLEDWFSDGDDIMLQHDTPDWADHVRECDLTVYNEHGKHPWKFSSLLVKNAWGDGIDADKNESIRDAIDAVALPPGGSNGQ